MEKRGYRRSGAVAKHRPARAGRCRDSDKRPRCGWSPHRRCENSGPEFRM